MSEPRELSVSRHIDAPPETVWKIRTERTGEWFCPPPWRAEVIVQDLRPGGRSHMIFHGPNGEKMPQEGVFLEVVPGERIVSTDAIHEGWVPNDPFLLAVTSFEPEGAGTRYTARARHWTDAALKQHRDMGFEEGWGMMADQLKSLCEEGSSK